MKKNILVTGCGGDIGTGIGRILTESFPDHNIIGADSNENNPGKFIFDSVVNIPSVSSERYLTCLSALVEQHSVDLIIPLSEAEIRFFHSTDLHESYRDIPVIMVNKKTIAYSLDKLKTAAFLTQINLPAPWTMLVQDEPCALPCIVKDRGLSAKGGVELCDANSVGHFRLTKPNGIWQEYLSGDEYTCGLYGAHNGTIRSIILKRQLSHGNAGFTVSGEVASQPEISAALEVLARNLDLRGSCNVQLRLTPDGPKIFEINPRFSSTVVFRHKLGFQDVLWSYEEKMGAPLSAYVPPKPGVKFYKGYVEYIETEIGA